MKLEHKIYWATAIIALLVFFGSTLTPEKPAAKNDLPWHIEHATPDTSRIFGITLGKSSVNDAEQRFQEEAKPSLFKSQSGQLSAEMFFEQVTLVGLKAKIVVSIAVPEAELQAMYERGIRISGTLSGKKITPATEDVLKLRTLPINSLTYIPSVRVEESVFSKRFGVPARRIKENGNGAIHWLYPKDGLDITLGGEEKPVLQYVSPVDFDKLLQPLLNNGIQLN